MGLMPKNIRLDDARAHDPFPPPGSKNIYEALIEQRRSLQASHQREGGELGGGEGVR